MAAVAVGTGCGCSVSVGDCTPVDALLVKFDGMSEGNFVARQKLLVGVARGASLGQIFLGNG